MPYTKGGLLKGALVGIPNIYNAMVGRSITMLESMKFGLGGGGGSKSTTSSASSMNAEKAVAASPAPSAAYKDLLAQIGDAEVCRHISALNPYGRLDFAIQEGVLESQYLTALSSHMSYWQDQDANTFMLKELYKYH